MVKNHEGENETWRVSTVHKAKNVDLHDRAPVRKNKERHTTRRLDIKMVVAEESIKGKKHCGEWEKYVVAVAQCRI